MKLSSTAIQDLRLALRRSYGENFDISLNDEEVNEIGFMLFTLLSENLKHKITTNINKHNEIN